MPIQKCQRNGKKGWKYGKSGFCYTGRDALEKAKKQGRAIALSKARKKGYKIPKKK